MRASLPLCLCLALMTPAVAGAALPKKDEPVTPQQTWNPRPDHFDIILPMPCGLSMAFRAVAMPGRAGEEFPFVMGMAQGDKERRIYGGERRQGRIAGVFAAHDLPIAWRSQLPKRQSENHTFYFLGKYEVSQAQWDAVMNDTCPVPAPPEPSLLEKAKGWVGFKTEKPATPGAALPPEQALPVRGLSWARMQAFIERYNAWLKENADKFLPRFVDNPKNRGFLRLPNEAEWEFAARGGLEASEAEREADMPPFADDRLEDYAVFGGEALAAVGARRPNPLGLYDMAGNVKEMTDEPFRVGGSVGGQVVKGGGFRSRSDGVLPGWRDEADRSGDAPNDQGFRLVLSGKLTASARRVEALNQDGDKGEQAAALARERARLAEEKAEVERLRQVAEQQQRAAQEQARQAEEKARELARLVKEQAEAERMRQEAARPQQQPPVASTMQTYTNSIGMEFVLIPAGTFQMGCASIEEEGCDLDETPRHAVTISKPFYLGKYEVTQAQWEAVMGANPSRVQGADRPVEQVSWEDVQEFIRQLNAKASHNRYRLPTEAEWEFAAREENATAYNSGNYEGQLGTTPGMGLFRDPHPVGQEPSNAWGLFDMHGNVWEWVQDWYGERYYAHDAKFGVAVDPQGWEWGVYRVLRGGGGCNDAGRCRSTDRFRGTPDLRNSSIGFRLALSPGP